MEAQVPQRKKAWGKSKPKAALRVILDGTYKPKSKFLAGGTTKEMIYEMDEKDDAGPKPWRMGVGRNAY